MVVRVLKKEGGWYYVQSLDDRYLGWMETDHLAFVTKEQADAFSQRAAGRSSTSLFAFVREQPAADAPPVSDLVVGNVMAVAGQTPSGSWFAVQLPDGRKGFVAQADAADYARLEGVARDHAGEHRADRAPVHGRAVPVGRHVREGLRLLGVRQDGVPPERLRAAARRGPAVERGRAGGDRRTTWRS